jgi:hypothetical protein
MRSVCGGQVSIKPASVLEYSLEQKLKKSLQVAQSSRMALMMQHEANNDVKYALKQLIDGVLPCF